MIHDKTRNGSADVVPVQARSAMVDASKDSGIMHFQDGPRETWERPPKLREPFRNRSGRPCCRRIRPGSSV